MGTYLKTISSDLVRYIGEASFRGFVIQYCTRPEFRFIFWMRTTLASRRIPALRILYWSCRLQLRRLRYKFGINIPYNVSIKPGSYIGHFGGIVVHPEAVIGMNCNLSSGVTIGFSNRGKHQGVPIIGDGVYIGPGAKIFGGINIGNNVVIGANCVINDDIPDNAVVAAPRGQIISYSGAEGYVTKTVDHGGLNCPSVHNDSSPITRAD